MRFASRERRRARSLNRGEDSGILRFTLNANPTPGCFREDYLRLWVAEDGSKSMQVRRGKGGKIKVAVWRGFREQLLVNELPARWKDADPAAAKSSYALSRIGYLQVELGMENLGTTYDLMFAAPSSDLEASGGFLWRAVEATDAIEIVRIFPQGGASYYEAVLGAWDDFVEDMRDAEQSWITPLSTYRPATEEETSRWARTST